MFKQKSSKVKDLNFKKQIKKNSSLQQFNIIFIQILLFFLFPNYKKLNVYKGVRKKIRNLELLSVFTSKKEQELSKFDQRIVKSFQNIGHTKSQLN